MKTYLLFLQQTLLLVQVTSYTLPSVSSPLRSSFKGNLQLFGTRTSQRVPSPLKPLFASQHSNDGDDKSLFNPLNLSTDEWMKPHQNNDSNRSQNIIIDSITPSSTASSFTPLFATVTAIAILSSTTILDNANAISLSTGEFNPDNFRPVCPASDSIYRFAQSSTQSLVGQDNFVEYGPLIAGGLLRVRLELCVVESFFNEAVGPFIEREGLGWILPLHETVETFLAGTIFALASTFILVGSTKIVSVLVTYADVFVGAPLRLFGGFAFDRAKGKPVTFDIGLGPFKTRVIGPGNPKDDQNKEETLEEILDFSQVKGKDLPVALLSGAVKGVGETSKFAREFLEALDLFVGRYLTLIATGYIGIKFIHFKIFPDFPPF